MEFSRRSLLQSTFIAAFWPKRSGSVICSLDESKQAFANLAVANGRLIVESSAGFEREDLSWLAVYGLKVGLPMPVVGPAYVRYNWPFSVSIRDFSRATRISGGVPIAYLAGIPVATRSECGRLIVLGSPLGPHLYAADPDAIRLAHHLIAAASTQTA